MSISLHICSQVKAKIYIVNSYIICLLFASPLSIVEWFNLSCLGLLKKEKPLILPRHFRPLTVILNSESSHSLTWCLLYTVSELTYLMDYVMDLNDQLDLHLEYYHLLNEDWQGEFGICIWSEKVSFVISMVNLVTLRKDWWCINSSGKLYFCFFS